MDSYGSFQERLYVVKKSHLGFWFYAHIATVISGLFMVRGELGWVLAVFSGACAWLIFKFPRKEPREVVYDENSGYDVDWLEDDPLTDSSYSFWSGNIYHHDDDSSATNMTNSITDPGYVGIGFGD